MGNLLIIFFVFSATLLAEVPLNLINGSYSGTDPLNRAVDNNETNSSTCNNNLHRLRSYENSYVGYRGDSTNDLHHADIKLSMLQDIVRLDYFRPEYDANLAFAFTGEYSFYLLQDGFSRPVIPTRQNPLLTIYGQLGSHHVWQIIPFAHESNGQSINSEIAYRNADKNTRDQQVSISWNYSELGYLYVDSGYSLGLSARSYLFNDEAEEYFEFLGDKPFVRRKYSDTYSIRFQYEKNYRSLNKSKIAKRGYRATVHTKFGVPDENGDVHGSVRVELGIRPKSFHTTFVGWVHHGYNLTPVQYNTYEDFVVGGYLEFLIN